MASAVLGLSAAGAGQLRPGVIGGVRIQPALQRTRGYPQRLLPGRGFQRLKVQTLRRLPS
jgi:hypothetical protein